MVDESGIGVSALAFTVDGVPGVRKALLRHYRNPRMILKTDLVRGLGGDGYPVEVHPCVHADSADAVGLPGIEQFFHALRRGVTGHGSPGVDGNFRTGHRSRCGKKVLHRRRHVEIVVFPYPAENGRGILLLPVQEIVRPVGRDFQSMPSGSDLEGGIGLSVLLHRVVISVEKVIMGNEEFIRSGLKFLLESQCLTHVAVQFDVSDHPLGSLSVGIVYRIEDILSGMVSADEGDMGMGSHYPVYLGRKGGFM